MNAKDCKKFAKPKRKLSLRSALKLAARIGLLTTSALAVPFALRAATSAIEFKSDFESGNYKEWRAGEINTPWALQIVPGFGSNRSKVARFEYRNTDVVNYDTVKADLAGTHTPMGSDQWYAFEYYLPDDFTTGSQGTLIFQNHSGVSALGSGLGFKPPTYLSVNTDKNGTEFLTFGVNYTPDGKVSRDSTKIEQNIGTAIKGAWQKGLLHVNWQPNSNGKVEFYLNGQLKYSRSGVIGYDDNNGEERGTYPRLGLYLGNDKKDLDRHPPVSVIYFDNFLMGSTRASVDSDSPPTPSEQGNIRVEAENMFLADYRIESKSAASNGQLISLFKAKDTTDTASSTFAGDSGKYDVYVGYFDENDGVANLQVNVGGVQLADLQLDQDLGSGSVNAKTLVRQKVASEMSINKGARIEIKGTANQGEWARVDYVDFVPVP